METSNYPEIDDVLGNILADGTASPENTTSLDPEETSATEATVPATLTDSRQLLSGPLSRLPYAGKDSTMFKVRIYSEIMTTLQSCELGTTSMSKIINAILLDFIERNSETLRRNRRRSLIDG